MARDTRLALLAAAQKSFAARGYGGTSVRQLARAAGIKESSLYNHFASKQELLEAVIERAATRLAAVAERFHVSFDDAEAAAPFYARVTLARFKALLEAFFHEWLYDADVVAARRVLTLEQYRTSLAGNRLRELTVEGPLRFQTELFRTLIGRGVFRPADPEAVALAFWGPIFAILAAAERDDAADRDAADRDAADRDAADRDVAEQTYAQAVRRIQLHLEHFIDAHLAEPQPSKE